MIEIPKTVPPIPPETTYRRAVSTNAAMAWLRAGWADFKVQPATSLLYGLAVYLASLGVVAALFMLDFDYLLFPALAGFMVVGPLLAVGLYEKSRRITAGTKISLGRMIFVKPRAGGQVLFIGVLLCLLMLLWMRSAVLIYALFFGLQPFPGLDHVTEMLFTTSTGWALLLVGSAVGGLFAAFAFAISVFSVPMMLDERVDALTAMGTSMAIVWNNLPVMLTWGAILLVFTVINMATGLLTMVVVFPLLGHATWHAYRQMGGPPTVRRD